MHECLYLLFLILLVLDVPTIWYHLTFSIIDKTICVVTLFPIFVLPQFICFNLILSTWLKDVTFIIFLLL